MPNKPRISAGPAELHLWMSGRVGRKIDAVMHQLDK